MTQLVALPLRTALRRALPTALLGLMVASPVWAEKADRTKPINVVADRTGTFDLLKQVVVFSGDVMITKGSIVIKADRVEVRETPDGYKTAVAIGGAGHPATFRQKREGIDEFIDGQADRLEYDEKPDTVRFVNNATVRRLRGVTPADEITGSLITYDNTTEVFSVASGTPGTTAGSPGGRVRAVLTPREGTPAAAEAAAAAGVQLKSSRALGEKK